MKNATTSQSRLPVRRTAIEREHDVEDLARRGGRTGKEGVLSAIDDRSPGVRARAAEALSCFPGVRSHRALLRLLSDRDEMVRLNAVESLGNLRAKGALRAIAEHLRSDRDRLVRAYSAEAIGKMRDVTARRLLQDCLRLEKSSAVRLRLTEALYRLGERRRWKEILVFLADDDYHVRSAAAATLEELLTPTRKAAILGAIRAQLKQEPTVAVADRLRSILHDAGKS